MGLVINGKTANTKPNYPIVITGKYQRLIVPVVNGLVPYHININGLDRPPVLSGCVLNLPLWHPALGGTPLIDLSGGISGAVTGAIWTPDGRVLDGSDDNVSLGTPATIPDADEARTFEGWVKVGASPAASHTWFLASGTNVASNDTFWLATTNYGTQPILTTAGAGYDLLGTAFDPLVWHYIAATYATGIECLYVDGAFDVTKDITSTNTNGTATYVGKCQGASAPEHFKGTIGEVRIYNRALSAAEIKRNYLVTRWRYS